MKKIFFLLLIFYGCRSTEKLTVSSNDNSFSQMKSEVVFQCDSATIELLNDSEFFIKYNSSYVGENLVYGDYLMNNDEIYFMSYRSSPRILTELVKNDKSYVTNENVLIESSFSCYGSAYYFHNYIVGPLYYSLNDNVYKVLDDSLHQVMVRRPKNDTLEIKMFSSLGVHLDTVVSLNGYNSVSMSFIEYCSFYGGSVINNDSFFLKDSISYQGRKYKAIWIF